MSLHLKSSNYDFYQYKIESNMNLPRSHYKVTVSYEHDWIQYRSGRYPYCKFNTSSLVLEVYNRARVTETFTEHLTISAQNLITGKTATKFVKITWLFIPPEVSWTDETLKWVHPIVEIVYELENYRDLRMSIVGDDIVQVAPKEDEQYLTRQYYVQSSMPLSDSEKELILDIPDELRSYVTWDEVFRKLYIDRTAPLKGTYELEFKLQCKYLENQILKPVQVVYDNGTQAENEAVLATEPLSEDIRINLLGAESVSVPETGSGYDSYCYEIQTSPVLSRGELDIEYTVTNSPEEDAVILDTNTMILKVRNGLTYKDTHVVINVSYNENRCTKTVAVTNDLYTELRG